MPDPERLTVSASQAAGLLNQSRYVTRWMLYQQFKNGISLDVAEDSRMRWGKRMQPLILEQVQADLRLEMIPNVTDTYLRNGPLGCTRDAMTTDPEHGPGAVEVKCVFDFSRWMQAWAGGDHVPIDIEAQLQCQMIVGQDQPYQGMLPFTWGVIAVWVCGEMHYFRRDLSNTFADLISGEAERFFSEVEAGTEPDPFGSPREDEIIKRLWPRVERPKQEIENRKLAEQARMYAWAKERIAGMDRTVKELRPILMHAAEDCQLTTVTVDGIPAAQLRLAKNKALRVVALDHEEPGVVPGDDNPMGA